MRQLSTKLALMCCGAIWLFTGCAGSDPNLEGAKLDLSNKDYAQALENVEAAVTERLETRTGARVEADETPGA